MFGLRVWSFSLRQCEFWDRSSSILLRPYVFCASNLSFSLTPSDFCTSTLSLSLRSCGFCNSGCTSFMLRPSDCILSLSLWPCDLRPFYFWASSSSSRFDLAVFALRAYHCRSDKRFFLAGSRHPQFFLRHCEFWTNRFAVSLRPRDFLARSSSFLLRTLSIFSPVSCYFRSQLLF